MVETRQAGPGGAAAPPARHARKRQRRRAQEEERRRYESATGRGRRLSWAGGILAAALVLGGLALWLARPTPGPGGLPGPLGGPSVAKDVNTLVGQSAPGFALPDADGTTYTVTPGQGRPLVLVFHMGIT
jgi:hypothetical protein